MAVDDKGSPPRAAGGLSDADPSSPSQAPPRRQGHHAVASIAATDASSSSDAASSAPPLGAPRHRPGVAWKVVTFPFYAVAGVMDILFGTLRLGARAVVSVRSLLGLEPPVYAGVRANRLPPDAVIDIACRLRASRQDVQAMRSVCPEWRAVIPNTNGPWLVLSRLQGALPSGGGGGGGQNIVLQMLTPPGATAAVTDLEMAIVPCLSSPPPSTTCWGAAHGLVALKQYGTNSAYLFCLICGNTRDIPSLSDKLTPRGIFFDEHPLEPLAILSTNQAGHHPRLHYEMQDAHGHRWVMYPGTDAHFMMSVGFSDGVHFIGATSDNMVIIDELGGPPGHDMVFLNVPLPADGQMIIWNDYGHHLFKCSDNLYLCLLFRDYEDVNIVSASVFVLQLIPGVGHDLVPTNDIGNYAVYLGANKPVVLPAEDGSFIQRRNTIYVTDDDGYVRNGRVLHIDVSSHEVWSTPFPNGVSINDYGRTSWVAAPPLNGTIWHMWHCNN